MSQLQASVAVRRTPHSWIPTQARRWEAAPVWSQPSEAAGTLTIKHDAIPAVNWPAMTMAFKAAPAALLDGLKVGAKIKFDVNDSGADAEVTALTPQ